MKKLKKLMMGFLVVVILSANTIVIHASSFNDIKPDDEQYTAIETLFAKGLMVGDMQGNFNKNDYISNFDFVEIISKLQGYTGENDDVFYEKYENLILSYSNKYEKWDNNINDVLIFLLAEGILKEEDLQRFIILDENENENIRATSREEVALLLSRVLISDGNIYDKTGTKKFEDEKLVDEAVLDYCYYMSSLGILEVDKQGKFNPKQAVTRYELTKILDKFIKYRPSHVETLAVNISEEHKEQMLYSRFVNITKVFPKEDSIQIKVGNESRIYKLAENPTIDIDTVSSYLVDIEEGVSGTIYIKDDLVYKVVVRSDFQIANVADENTEKMYVTIKNISTDTIGVSYKVLDEKNVFNIEERIEIIPLKSDYKILKSGISVDNIKENALASLVLENGEVSEILLEEENAIFISNIIDIKPNKITIKTIDEKIFELIIKEETKIFRNDKKADYSSLKLGDRVNIEVSGNFVSKISSFGILEQKQGVIKNINISEEGHSITIIDEKNTKNIYFMDLEDDTIYDMRIGDNVQIISDSYEVQEVEIIG